jgi:hypothetical protein
MRELHATTSLKYSEFGGLKQRSLLFDRFHIINVPGAEETRVRFDDLRPEEQADVLFLEERKLILRIPNSHVRELLHSPKSEKHRDYVIERLSEYWDGEIQHLNWQLGQTDHAQTRMLDLASRQLAEELNQNHNIEAVPIYYLPLFEPREWEGGSDGGSQQHLTAFHIALEALPTPDSSVAWQDIIDFKEDSKGKLWALRRFLHSLATKEQNEALIRDELEWTINEYSKAMQIHKMKASQSFVDVFVVTPLEIFENIMKLNWSKIAKGTVSFNKRKVDLMEAEMKAPGRECAYIFDARKRFGNG